VVAEVSTAVAGTVVDPTAADTDNEQTST
jgi:hypothetical protein